MCNSHSAAGRKSAFKMFIINRIRTLGGLGRKAFVVASKPVVSIYPILSLNLHLTAANGHDSRKKFAGQIRGGLAGKRFNPVWSVGRSLLQARLGQFYGCV